MAALAKMKKPPAIDDAIFIFIGGDPKVGKSTLVKHLENVDWDEEEKLPLTIMSAAQSSITRVRWV